ncbi:Protein sfk1 [Paraphaeosphaeria sporulosa]
MLLTWVGRACPHIGSVLISGYGRFISDIAAFQLKPLFLIGSITTSFSYSLTILAVHTARYDRRMYGFTGDTAWKRTASVVAMCSAVVAGIGLTLLAVLDTFRFHSEHAALLLVCFVGLAGSMVLTTVVWWERAWEPSSTASANGSSCATSAIIVFLDAGMGVAFYTLMQMEHWRVSGVLEWTMAFTGAVWLWGFVGFLKVPEGGGAGERRALLGESQ